MLEDFAISKTGEQVWFFTVRPQMGFDEIIPSWNVSLAPNAKLSFAIRPVAAGKTDWIEIGTCPALPTTKPPAMELIHLKSLVREVKIRMTLTQPLPGQTMVRLLAISVSNAKFFGPSGIETKVPAWGVIEPLPEPDHPMTATELMLRYWSQALGVPKLYADLDSFDRLTGGNLTLQVAYAGSVGTMLAYRTRATAILDIESWTQRSVPVICDLGSGTGLKRVIVTGFNLAGDPVLLNPLIHATKPISMIRDSFELQWLKSKRSLTMILPYAVYTPPDTKGVFLHGHQDPAELGKSGSNR